MTAKDGGKAFARASDQVGMTLRDFQAGQALPALITALHKTESPTNIATLAYEYGLHMVDARDRVDAR